MDINTLTTAVVTIMSQIALKQGPALVEEVGARAAEKAQALYKRTLDHLRSDAATERVAQRYAQNPEKMAGALEMELAELFDQNAAFRQEVMSLLEAYQTEKQNYEVATGGGAFAGRDMNIGGDYVAGDKVGGDKVQGDKITSSTAVGERGVNVSGQASGPIITDSGNVINMGGDYSTNRPQYG
jgi:hypothetical protein